MPETDISELLQSILLMGLQGLIAVLFIALAILNIKQFKNHYKTGLLIGIIAFLMTVPVAIFNLIHFNPSALLGKNQALPKQFFDGVVYIGIVIGALILVFKIGWHMIIYYVAVSEWDKIRPQTFTFLKKNKNIPWQYVLAAAVFGAGVGVLSAIVFLRLGMEESEALKRIMEWFPGVEKTSLVIKIPVLLLAVTVPAVIEELVFRGGLLAFLLRLSGNKSLMIWGSTIFVSLLWAILHIGNTNMPLVKCLQIFLVGVVFCEFTRRSCIEAAIAGHLSLNITAVIMYFILTI